MKLSNEIPTRLKNIHKSTTMTLLSIILVTILKESHLTRYGNFD